MTLYLIDSVIFALIIQNFTLNRIGEESGYAHTDISYTIFFLILWF